jgi:ABC-type antimicrobial peptide transport system permease subunit
VAALPLGHSHPSPLPLVREGPNTNDDTMDNEAPLPIFAGVTLVLTTVALLASYVPALRAMRLDPITTLHSE